MRYQAFLGLFYFYTDKSARNLFLGTKVHQYIVNQSMFTFELFCS